MLKDTGGQNSVNGVQMMHFLRIVLAISVLIPVSAAADNFIKSKESVKDPEKFLLEQKAGFDREFAKLTSAQQQKIRIDADKLQKKIAAQKQASPEELAQYIASGFGIPPESKIAKRFAKQVRQFSSGIQRTAPSASQESNRPPVIQQISFHSGIPFPSGSQRMQSSEMYVPEVSTQESPARETSTLDTEEIRKKRSEKVRKIFTPLSLPRCADDTEQSFRNEAKHPTVRSALKNDVLFDAIFLKNEAPRDGELMIGFDELFGRETKVHHYTEKYGDPVSTLVSSYGITCLPFRIRVTKEKIQRFYGKKALRSYAMTKKKNKKGKFHPLVERRLRDFY